MGPTMKDFTKQPLQTPGTAPSRSEPLGGQKQQGGFLNKECFCTGGQHVRAAEVPVTPGAALERDQVCKARGQREAGPGGG